MPNEQSVHTVPLVVNLPSAHATHTEAPVPGVYTLAWQGRQMEPLRE